MENYKKAHVIFKENDKSNKKFYIMISGKVAVIK